MVAKVFIQYFACTLLLLPMVVEGKRGGGGRDAPDISLVAWVGEMQGGRGPLGDYFKRDVSHSAGDEAPVTLLNATTFILKNEVTLIVFACHANYPVTFDFPNSKWFFVHDQSFGVYLTTSQRASGESDIGGKGAYTYSTQLVLFGDSQMFNGQYGCRAIAQDNDHKGKDDDQGSRATITLFWEGGPFDNLFALAGKNVTVYVESAVVGNGGVDRVVFPCMVNNPFARVVLQQQGQNGSGWVRYGANFSGGVVPPWPRWVAEEGFVFESPSQSPSYPDSSLTYKCTTQEENDNDDDDVIITFRPQAAQYVSLDKRIRTNATFGRDPVGGAYSCCSSSATPPTLTVHSCGDPSSCRQLIPALQAQEYSLPDANAKGSTTMNRIAIGRHAALFNSVNGSCAKYRSWYSQFDMDMVSCEGDGISVLRKYFPRLNKPLAYDDWGEGERLEELVKISVPQKALQDYKVLKSNESGKGGMGDIYEVYSGSSVVVKCEGSFYFFSYGIRFSVKEKEDKPRVLPDTFEADVKSKYGLKMLLLLHNPPLFATANVSITQETKSLTCHVPITANDQWVTKTINFKVKAPKKPLIVEGVSGGETAPETVTWGLNETDKTLSCKVFGEPEPFVIWMKDDKMIGGKGQKGVVGVVEGRGVGGAALLHFPRATHDLQGTYKCIASNFAGTAQKTFNLLVQESGGVHVAAIVISTLVLIAIFAGVGVLLLRAWRQKRSLQSLRQHVYQEQQDQGQTVGT